MSIIYSPSSCYGFSHGFLHSTLLSTIKPLKLCRRALPQISSSSSSSSSKKEEDPEEKEKETSRKNSSSSSLELERGGIVKGFGTNLSTPKSSSSKDKGKQVGSTLKEKQFSTNTTSRRPSPVKPLVAPSLNPEAQQIENASVLALASIGLLIFIEGLALAASGLLPEEWDAVITKFVYPSFTPTVGLFLAGAVFYGVYKILQGNDSENN